MKYTAEERQRIATEGQLALIRREIELARDLQRSILPTRFPKAAGIELHAAMLPAQDVGGDFYDFFPLDGGRLGFVVADVAGKGLAAALFMAVARTTLRATARIVADPGACLAETNDQLANDNDACMFVTALYGVLDPATGQVAYANGGHNRPVLLGPSGDAAEIAGESGIALGVMAGFPFATESLILPAGASLLLYDGVSEAFDTREQLFGEDRLMALLDGHGRDAAARLVARVVAGVRAFARGAPQNDDITCLVIRRPPEAADA